MSKVLVEVIKMSKRRRNEKNETCALYEILTAFFYGNWFSNSPPRGYGLSAASDARSALDGPMSAAHLDGRSGVEAVRAH
jgi:hypothetical protein